MFQYPGLKTGANGEKDQSRQKQSKTKVKGNTWSEQDDALFGPSPAMYCEPCASTTRTSTTTNNEKQSASASASASSINKLHLKVSAKNAASKLTGFLTKARDDVVDATLEAKRRNDKAWNKKNAAIPISSARKPAPTHASLPALTTSVPTPVKPAPTRASLPAFTTSVPAPMKPPPSHNFGMRLSKIVTETLTSQVPFPCAHCNAIPLMYQYHPFFGKAQRICSTHPLNSVIQCVSCSRYQTRGDPFAAIGTSSARICSACARTAILDNGAAKMLYEHVLQFMESQGLDMFDGKMKNIPVILADENSLDRQSSSIGCEAKGQKRGLTIWREMHVPIPNVLSMAKSASKLMKRVISSKEASSNNGGEDEVKRNVWAGTRHVDVVKILCLKGLPRNLMASILAHEGEDVF